MKRRWIEYQCSLPKVTLEDLLSRQASLYELGIENIVEFDDGTYGVSGRIRNCNTKTEANNKFKLIKLQLEELFGVKKIVDKLVAKGEISYF